MGGDSITFKQRLLLELFRSSLSRNDRFRDIHKGEACYIFGNGISIKSADLNLFTDAISIGCNSLFLHRDFGKLHCPYYQIPAPWFCYPYRKYYGKWQRNYISALYRQQIQTHRSTHFFTTLSNRLLLSDPNVSYLHHGGHRQCDLNRCDMAGTFSFLGGATLAMLGTAIYMGFDRANLIGVDYLNSPQLNLHFFEKGRGSISSTNRSSDTIFGAMRSRIELTLIVPNGMKSDILPYVEYSNYTGTVAHYRENTEIVDAAHLYALHRLGFYNIY